MSARSDDRGLYPLGDGGGWHQLTQQLEYNAEQYGRDFVQVDKWYPSLKCCFHCGHITDTMPLNIRTWDFPACGTQGIDRDVNAARNILQLGKAMLAGLISCTSMRKLP